MDTTIRAWGHPQQAIPLPDFLECNSRLDHFCSGETYPRSRDRMGKDSERLRVNRIRQVLPEFVERLWNRFIPFEAQVVPRQQSRYTRASSPVGAFAPDAGFPLDAHHSANGIIEFGA